MHCGPLSKIVEKGNIGGWAERHGAADGLEWFSLRLERRLRITSGLRQRLYSRVRGHSGVDAG
jgi:hypothetical protein